MRKTPEFEDCFAELISIPSVSSIDPAHDQSNRLVVDSLANYLDMLGFDCHIMSVSDNPEKVNLIARRGELQEQATGLVLSGHTDTVPYDENGWDTDPFILTNKNNNYYGLGTADMKSFFPIIFEALERMPDLKFEQPLTVVATADEESTMSGARQIYETNKTLGRHCIIGEPTGMVPRYMHKGIIIETINIEGQSGHSSDPSLGNSALEGMTDVINNIRNWREKLQSENQNKAFKIPFPTINLGRIQGGDSPNRICATCELAIDLRPLPGMLLDQLKKELHQLIIDTLAGSGLKVTFGSVFNGVPPMHTPIDSEIVSFCVDNLSIQASTVAFTTEGPFFNDMGMETVILGPGDIDVAHQPNEYLQIDRIEPMINFVSKALENFCGKS
ncbi:MAG: acetylornithine deacetylase [Pseudomonadota bacterium]